MSDEAAPRILIVRLSAMGDVVNALPVLTALRQARPDSHIAWAVESGQASLLEAHPDLNDLIVIDRKRHQKRGRNPLHWPAAVGSMMRLRRELREQAFDIVLDLQGNLRSGLVSRLSGAPVRVGYDRANSREGNRLLNNRHVTLPLAPIKRAARHLHLLTGIGIAAPDATARVDVPDGIAEAAGKFFGETFGDGARVVAMHPGTSEFGAYKQWPPERYAILARRMAEDGWRTLLTWGPGERTVTDRIVTDAKGAAVIAPSTDSLKLLAALLKRCDLFIGGDTGPMHLAAAVGTPVVALFGPKDPRIYGPYGVRHVIVEKDLPCRPCSKRHCDDPRCMTTITVDDVLTAVAEV